MTEPTFAGTLGRRLSPRRDPRSLLYKVKADGSIASARWERVTPILDQGNLGSCTGNATIGVLGTAPFYDTVKGLSKLDEAAAVAIYSAATAIDPYPDQYPPTDTGSDGLSVAKAAKAAGLIGGYLHITSVAAAQTAIQSGPFIVGSEWRSSMDKPDASGRVHATGAVRGGHEYECLGYDATADLWELCNSWGPNWAKAGHFFYSSGDLASLLAASGDATVFTPLTVPAPTPTPTPGGAVSVSFTSDDWATIGVWQSAPHTYSKSTKAARAVSRGVIL